MPNQSQFNDKTVSIIILKLSPLHTIYTLLALGQLWTGHIGGVEKNIRWKKNYGPSGRKYMVFVQSGKRYTPKWKFDYGFGPKWKKIYVQVEIKLLFVG